MVELQPPPIMYKLFRYKKNKNVNKSLIKFVYLLMHPYLYQGAFSLFSRDEKHKIYSKRNY